MNTEVLMMIRRDELIPSLTNPREKFDAEKLQELADSMRETKGNQQALLVRPLTGKTFEIVCGERRWRASELAGLTELKCEVTRMSDGEVRIAQCVENCQREDVEPIEEARGFYELIRSRAFTVDSLAKRLGKSRSHVFSRLGLLKLDEPIREAVEQGKISHHVAPKVALLPKEERENAIEAVKGLSVRQASELVESRIAEHVPERAKKKEDRKAESKRLERENEEEQIAPAKRLKGGTVEIGIRNPSTKQRRANCHGVFEDCETVSIRVGFYQDFALELHVAQGPGGRWYSSYSFGTGGHAVGCGSSTSLPSINGESFDNRADALKSAFGNLVGCAISKSKDRTFNRRGHAEALVGILEQVFFFSVHQKAEQIAKSAKESSSTYFIVRRDFNGTYLSASGGWCKKLEVVKRFASEADARRSSWMQGYGHTVCQVRGHLVLPLEQKGTKATKVAKAEQESGTQELRKGGAFSPAQRRAIAEAARQRWAKAKAGVRA